LVRHADDPANADYYLALRGGGHRALTRHLRAAELDGAKASSLWKTPACHARCNTARSSSGCV